jgi:hypothetical protein
LSKKFKICAITPKKRQINSFKNLKPLRKKNKTKRKRKRRKNSNKRYKKPPKSKVLLLRSWRSSVVLRRKSAN